MGLMNSIVYLTCDGTLETNRGTTLYSKGSVEKKWSTGDGGARLEKIRKIRNDRRRLCEIFQEVHIHRLIVIIPALLGVSIGHYNKRTERRMITHIEVHPQPPDSMFDRRYGKIDSLTQSYVNHRLVFQKYKGRTDQQLGWSLPKYQQVHHGLGRKWLRCSG